MRKLAIFIAVPIGFLVYLSTAHAETPQSSQSANVAINFGVTKGAYAKGSSAEVYDPKTGVFVPCTASSCGRFKRVGQGIKQYVVLKVSAGDKLVYGSYGYNTADGRVSLNYLRLKRKQHIPTSLVATVNGQTLQFQLSYATALLVDPRQAVPPPLCDIACSG